MLVPVGSSFLILLGIHLVCISPGSLTGSLVELLVGMCMLVLVSAG